MLNWLKDNLATIIIGLALLGALAAIVVNSIKKRKKGMSSCGCGCSGCPMSGACHPEK